MRNKSFTLIELLVVIVIIGILAGVIIVSTSSSINKANFAKAQAFSNTIKNSLMTDVVSGWSFDEGLGVVDGAITISDIEDNWGNSNGAVVGNPILKNSDCISKKCILFDDDTDCIIITPFYGTVLKGSTNVDVNNYDKNLTISAWAKPSFLDATGRLVFGDNNYNEGLVSFYSTYIVGNWSQSVTHSINPSLGKWYHVAITHELNTNDNNYYFHLYIDGKDVGTYTRTISYVASYGPDNAFTIGKYWRGLIDEVIVFDQALSTSQIKEQYIAGLNSLLANNNISKEEYDQRLNNLAYDKE